jgi:hypothetical protein
MADFIPKDDRAALENLISLCEEIAPDCGGHGLCSESHLLSLLPALRRLLELCGECRGTADQHYPHSNHWDSCLACNGSGKRSEEKQWTQSKTA